MDLASRAYWNRWAIRAILGLTERWLSLTNYSDFFPTSVGSVNGLKLAEGEVGPTSGLAVLSLMTGARTEELRALTWAQVDLEGRPDNDPQIPPSVHVWCSVRVHGDPKTRRSRRSLALLARCVQVLTDQYERQDLPTGDMLVFPSKAGTQLDRHNVLRAFQPVIKAAGLDLAEWTPGELRHSFVSLLSDSGVSIEEITDLCGHSGTSITESVYRHQLRPVLLNGAVAMDRIFGSDVIRGG
jgi:integrase